MRRSSGGRGPSSGPASGWKEEVPSDGAAAIPAEELLALVPDALVPLGELGGGWVCGEVRGCSRALQVPPPSCGAEGEGGGSTAKAGPPQQDTSLEDDTGGVLPVSVVVVVVVGLERVKSRYVEGQNRGKERSSFHQGGEFCFFPFRPPLCRARMCAHNTWHEQSTLIHRINNAILPLQKHSQPHQTTRAGKPVRGRRARPLPCGLDDTRCGRAAGS